MRNSKEFPKKRYVKITKQNKAKPMMQNMYKLIFLAFLTIFHIYVYDVQSFVLSKNLN